MTEVDRTRLERVFLTGQNQLLGTLVRRFGVDHLAAIENSVQEACCRALQQGPTDVDDRGLARWLLRVAHNRLVDTLRRERRIQPWTDAAEPTPLAFDEEQHIGSVDDELGLMFLCCHPALPRAAQVALTLRLVFGFSNGQIAQVFLADERAIAQRLVRAKRRLREVQACFEVPAPQQMPTRVPPMLDVLYQLLTDGNGSTAMEDGVDLTLGRESLRLLRVLTADERSATPDVEALRALTCFWMGRAPARFADDGSLLLLHEQERGRWDQQLVAEGFEWLARCARGRTASRYHLEAGIAACHARAPSYAATNWPEILGLYDMLRLVEPSPVVEVSRAFAVAMCHGAQAGLDALDAIPERAVVAQYPYALAMYAELTLSQGHVSAARRYLDRAIACQVQPAQQQLLRRKRAAMG